MIHRMRVMELLGHNDHSFHRLHHSPEEGTYESQPSQSPINVVVDKIKEIREGKSQGVVVYGYMSGCPHCIRYDDTWSEACRNCPKGVFTYKIMMEDFPEHHPSIGTSPRMFPTIYSYTKTPDGKILRKDHSQRRDKIMEIMNAISESRSFETEDGEEEYLDDVGENTIDSSYPSTEDLSVVSRPKTKKRSVKKSEDTKKSKKSKTTKKSKTLKKSKKKVSQTKKIKQTVKKNRKTLRK